jgi:hypothetical protein
VAAPAAPDTRTYLESLSHGELVDRVLEAATTSPELRRRLDARTATDVGEEVDVAALRALIDEALHIDGYVEYRQASGYADVVDGVADELERLLGEGLHEEAEDLARYAIGLLDENTDLVDDSSGDVGGAANHVVEVHVDACATAEKDPVELAEWLLERQLIGSGSPELPLESYADALGEQGMEHYGKKLARVREGRPARDWSSRFLMTEFARVSGDTDLLVRVYSEPDGEPAGPPPPGRD